MYLQLTFYLNSYIIDKTTYLTQLPSGLFVIEVSIELDNQIVAGLTVLLKTDD